VPGLKFGRLFGRTQHTTPPEDRDSVVEKLVRLGLCMNDPEKVPGQKPDAGKVDSDIPAGYTYLGQFIAHEITFDNTHDVLEADLKPVNLRTPEVDLDSLYGGENGPKDYPKLYQTDGVRLRTDETALSAALPASFPYDLPRRGMGDSPREALIADPRNDENLTLAQTHVAFIHFHNRVYDALRAREENKNRTPAQVFELAREQVVRHFQWVILHDFLPRLVRADVLDCVMRHGLHWFKGDRDPVFMPLEFSAAAFRIGHSMVRAVYEWNPYHRTTSKLSSGPVQLMDLFKQTGAIRPEYSGFGKAYNLRSDWIIDWRHFYDFSPLQGVLPVQDHNKAAKLDTAFNLHLDQVEGFRDEQIAKMQKAITVRNLLRGFYLGLPTGEEAAEWIGETPLTRKEVATGPHESVLDDPVFWGKTPLWYYVLKEAEVRGFGPEGNPGNRLGPVGSRIVAETLVGLVKHSRYSILEGAEIPADAKWRPAFGRPTDAGKPPIFEMIDLLAYAGVVDPLAEHLRRAYGDDYLGEAPQGAAAVA
jgi:hypothetical protein